MKSWRIYPCKFLLQWEAPRPSFYFIQFVFLILSFIGFVSPCQLMLSSLVKLKRFKEWNTYLPSYDMKYWRKKNFGSWVESEFAYFYNSFSPIYCSCGVLFNPYLTLNSPSSSYMWKYEETRKNLILPLIQIFYFNLFIPRMPEINQIFHFNLYILRMPEINQPF